jgi:hypothetical protein
MKEALYQRSGQNCGREKLQTGEKLKLQWGWKGLFAA